VRGFRRLRLLDALVLTAPFVAVLGYLLGASLLDLHRSLQFDDYWSHGVGLESRFAARAGSLRGFLPGLRAAQQIELEGADPGVIRLSLDPALLDAAYRDPQLGWGLWMSGDLVETGNRLLPVNVRKRGDNSVHWLTEKKTLTLRTTREDFFKQFRSFGLSGKDVLPAFVANRLAVDFSLLAPGTAVVPLVLNNRFAGMFRFVEVPDETFLRAASRMPGNIYRGDAAERGEYFKGLPRDLFANPYIWDRTAVSERPTGPGSGQLRRFLEDIAGGDFAAHLRMMGRLDRNELARLYAYLLLLGDPYHMDGVHNQLWYEDPSTALLHPIPWDVRILPLADLERVPLNRFIQAAFRDPFLLDGIQAELRRRLTDPGWRGRGDSLARATWRRYHAQFRYDSLRQGLIPPVGNPGSIAAILEQNARILEGWLERTEVRATGGPVLDLEIRGFASVELAGLELAGAAGAWPVLRMDRNENGILDSDDPAVPGAWLESRFTPEVPVPLLAAWRTDGSGIRPGRRPYRFFLPGLPVGARVNPVLRNRHTGSRVEPAAGTAGDPLEEPSGFSPWRFPPERGRLHRLAGTVVLAADLRLGPADTLLIAAGTQLRLGPDVSLLARGPVRAEGTAAAPIRVTRADPGHPWGAFALVGHGSDASRFRHVVFEGGGGALLDGIEFIGMVNVHRAREVLFEDVVFRDNVRSDDTFHALHAEVTIRRSHFLRANSDAVDYDMASGLIEATRFEDSGGDAIDLMTSTPLIRANTILRSGDKGISIGEASHPVIVGNLIADGVRGIEVKDRSAPVILDNTLTGNRLGLYANRKNWRYGGGGWATAVGSPLDRNDEPLRLDPFSRITLDQGAPAGLARVLASAPLRSVRFEEDFASATDGWVIVGGGVTRLAKEAGTLVAAVERRSGAIASALDWDLSRGAGATLVLQLAGRDIAAAELVLESADGAVRLALEPGNDPAVFRLAALPLPPRRYTAMRIRLTPRPRVEKRVRDPGWTELKPGQFWLRGYDLHARTLGNGS